MKFLAHFFFKIVKIEKVILKNVKFLAKKSRSIFGENLKIIKIIKIERVGKRAKKGVVMEIVRFLNKK